MSSPTAFTGSVPTNYHTHLGPLLFEPYAKDLAARLARASPTRILELACGTGISTRAILAASLPSATLSATDLNSAMLEIAKGVIATDRRATFNAVDACSLPYADASFDAIGCQFGVMFFADKVRAMREARRVLAPSGRYTFSVWDSLADNPIPRTVHETLATLFPTNPPPFIAQTPYGWSDPAEIERVVRTGGFTRIEIEPMTFESIAPSADDAARGWVEGTPVFAALQERGVTDFTPIRAAVALALRERFGNTPCRSTMRALVVTAG